MLTLNPALSCHFIVQILAAPRSGLAWKKHIDVGAGVIDADYRGNVGVVLFNHADADFESKPPYRPARGLPCVDSLALLQSRKGTG